MLAALKTASFAVTTSGEFRKMLYRLHIEHISSQAVADWIKFLTDTLWPNGVFYVSSPPLTPQQLRDQADKVRQLLHQNFPEQLRAILGNDLTKDGLDILYEMLQNRILVKSMAYMLFDLLWLEVFPEIGDVVECGAVLDINQ
jgi:hypothetical protein